MINKEVAMLVIIFAGLWAIGGAIVGKGLMQIIMFIIALFHISFFIGLKGIKVLCDECVKEERK